MAPAGPPTTTVPSGDLAYPHSRYLFLSLCYYETVNWANNEIPELMFIPLTIACVFFFTSSNRRATLWGIVFLILSIATFVSGFFLAIALH